MKVQLYGTVVGVLVASVAFAAERDDEGRGPARGAGGGSDSRRVERAIQELRRDVQRHQRPISPRERTAPSGGYAYTCVERGSGGARREVPCAVDVPSDVRAAYGAAGASRRTEKREGPAPSR